MLSGQLAEPLPYPERVPVKAALMLVWVRLKDTCVGLNITCHCDVTGRWGWAGPEDGSTSNTPTCLRWELEQTELLHVWLSHSKVLFLSLAHGFFLTSALLLDCLEHVWLFCVCLHVSTQQMRRTSSGWQRDTTWELQEGRWWGRFEWTFINVWINTAGKHLVHWLLIWKDHRTFCWQY